MTEPRSSLTVEAHPGPGVVRVILRGVIDETFPADQIVGGLERTRDDVVLDLGGVKRISSYGVRAWMRALARLPARRYWFIRCRPALMMQFNTVVGFAVDGTLLSFYSPYRCAKCDKQPELHVDLRTRYGDVASLTPQRALCPSCRTPLDFDEVPEDYFEYAASLPRPDPPPAVAALLASAHAARRRAGLRVETEVADDVTGVWLSGELAGRTRLERVATSLEGRVVVVMQGVDVWDDEGRAQLRAVLASRRVQPCVARLPLRLLRAAATQAEVADAVAGAPLCSLLAPAMCATCGAVTVEVGANAVTVPASTQETAAPTEAAAAAATVRAPCPSCRANLDISLSTAILGALTPCPAEVAAYMDRRVGPPKASAGAGGAPRSLGRYELLGQLGTGGMAEVFLARQKGLEGFEKRVVVKRLLSHLARDEQFVSMFLQEARLAARISHQNVVQVFDLGRAGDDHFIVMEYVHGWDLSTLARAHASRGLTMPAEIAARLVADIAAGLAAAHGHVDEAGRPLPIVHRDVSPHNVLVATTGQVKLADFGLAKAGESSEAMTRTGQLKGKIIYMAPEQIHGAAEPASDVWAAGLILYLLLTNIHPLRRESDVKSLHAALNQPIADVRDERADVPAELAAVVARALERDRLRRFRSGAALRDALLAFLAQPGRAVSTEELAAYLKTFPVAPDGPTSLSLPGFTPSSGSAMQTMINGPSSDGVGWAGVVDADADAAGGGGGGLDVDVDVDVASDSDGHSESE